MLLYRELDHLQSDDELKAYRQRLIDRFGPVPKEGEELMHVVTLRRLGKRLGAEKIMLKTGSMQMQYVRECALKEKNNKRYLRIKDVTSVEQAVELLRKISSLELK